MRSSRRPPTPPRMPRARHSRAIERPKIVNVFPSDLRIGTEIEGKYVETLPHYDGEGEQRGWKHHIDTRTGPILLFGTGRLDSIMAEYRLGEEIFLVYQGMGLIESGPKKGELAHLWRRG